MEIYDQLTYYRNNPQLPVDPDWVDAMAEEFPYLTEPAIMLLSRDTSAIPPERLQAIGYRLRMNTPDPEKLLTQLNPDAAQWVGIYPSTEPTPTASTDEAIDRFIATYGHSSPQEDALLEKLIFNPTPDYAQMLEQEEAAANAPQPQAVPGSQDDRINAFISKNTPPAAPKAPAPVEPQAAVAEPVEPAPEAPTAPAPAAPVTDIPADASLTEGLARVYIQQRRYDRAFEILRDISLKNPEKSIYFADQLRFLQKLIINQRHIDQRKSQNN